MALSGHPTSLNCYPLYPQKRTLEGSMPRPFQGVNSSWYDANPKPQGRQ
jgi:hypothetical protein